MEKLKQAELEKRKGSYATKYRTQSPLKIALCRER